MNEFPNVMIDDGIARLLFPTKMEPESFQHYYTEVYKMLEEYGDQFGNPQQMAKVFCQSGSNISLKVARARFDIICKWFRSAEHYVYLQNSSANESELLHAVVSDSFIQPEILTEVDCLQTISAKDMRIEELERGLTLASQLLSSLFNAINIMSSAIDSRATGSMTATSNIEFAVLFEKRNKYRQKYDNLRAWRNEMVAVLSNMSA